MAQIVVGLEQERASAWSFEVSVRGETGEASTELRLHWADYERWSQGRHAPARVAAAAIQAALDHVRIAELPDREDASAFARRHEGFMERVESLLDDPGFRPGLACEDS
ncbi:MAG: hypothetical protein AAGD00_09530 [Planctomycetota bacterium]